LGQIEPPVRTDCLIKRVFEPCLVSGIDIGIEKTFFTVLAVHVQDSMQLHLTFSQGTGLVRTQDIHTPEVLNRCQSFYYNLLVCHPFCPVGKVDTDNGRQELRSKPNCKGQGKEKRFKDRSVKVYIDSKDGDDEYESNL